MVAKPNTTPSTKITIQTIPQSNVDAASEDELEVDVDSEVDEVPELEVDPEVEPGQGPMVPNAIAQELVVSVHDTPIRSISSIPASV